MHLGAVDMNDVEVESTAASCDRLAWNCRLLVPEADADRPLMADDEEDDDGDEGQQRQDRVRITKRNDKSGNQWREIKRVIVN